MKRIALLVLAICLCAAPALAATQVLIDTNYGKITVELDEVKAPKSVANFLAYVDAKHYDGTIFHRVIKDFMIQGGNFSAEMAPKKTQKPIVNEAHNGLKNLRGTIAMARTGVVDSATSQFFINLKDNGFLDHRDKTVRGYGYAVFGKVVKGMEVVDKIGVTKTHTFKRFRDVPVETVVINSITRVAK
jgi:cyclophilin family peptidyl-prolyl cis-trans isomerase